MRATQVANRMWEPHRRPLRCRRLHLPRRPSKHLPHVPSHQLALRQVALALRTTQRHDKHGNPRTDDEERLFDAHIAIETAAIRETWTEADRRARAFGVTAGGLGVEPWIAPDVEWLGTCDASRSTV